MSEEHNGFEGWAIVELMGHRRIAGYVKEETIAGAGLLRVDIPNGKKTVMTQFYHPSSLYCLTPTTEATARKVALASLPIPVTHWELKAAPDIDD
jgi:hypothetical protein